MMSRKRRTAAGRHVISIGFALALAACGGGGTDVAAPLTGEAFCATLPRLTTGAAFFCGTAQANLQNAGQFQGYCMYTQENLGLVGYSVTTYNGGAGNVETQSEASRDSGLLGNQSPGYIRCTREST
jgi:hypothetical protein